MNSTCPCCGQPTAAIAPEAALDTLRARRLTERDLSVIRLAAAGWENKAIADRFAVSEQAVKNRLHRVFRRVGVGNRAGLAVWAVRAGLVGLAGGIGAAA